MFELVSLLGHGEKLTSFIYFSGQLSLRKQIDSPNFS